MEKDLFKMGAKEYGVYCAACHRADGRGAVETGPSLAGSKWVPGEPDLLASIVLHGKQGSTGMIMPPWGNVLNDRHIASILTHIRREWDNLASPVPAEIVRRARADSRSVQGLWTGEKLEEHAAKDRD
ncbi:MAG: c-type cytochrome [Opitutaceae bacterium]